jgi:hypothetical protein
MLHENAFKEIFASGDKTSRSRNIELITAPTQYRAENSPSEKPW